MKVITAVIKPFKLDEVKIGLETIGINGFTIVEAKGFGSQRGHAELYRGASYVVDYLPKVEVKVTVDDALVDMVVQKILETARSGRIGDGRITVTPVEQFWNIRTGENYVGQKVRRTQPKARKRA